jgi:hypothetical protein
MTANNEALLAERPTADLARLRARWLVLCGIGLVGLLIGFFTVDRETFMQSYLIGFMFWSAISIGSMAMLMVQYLSGGGWGLFARRVFEASARSLPLLAILFVPIALSLPVLYPWARPDALADPKIASKALYLNPTFFYIRAAIYFAIWMGLTFTLTRWSKEQDDNPVRLPGPKDGRMRVLSGPGLVLYMLTITFMSVDWVMSLEPHFTSTIWGILTLGGQGLSTLAFTILVLAALSRFKPVSELASEGNFHDLGKLMLAFVMLWAYFNVSQFIIIYQGNLPEEIPWYIDRITGPWAPVAVLVLIGHFALPFSLLLSRNWKRKGTTLARIAMFMLIMRAVDLIWTIGPIFRRSGSTLSWLDFAAVLGLGALWLLVFFRNLGARALVPAHDPYFEDALANVGH